MRKIFTFLCAALMSVGMFAATEVTITNSDFPMFGTSFTKDGVTVSAGMIDSNQGNINGPGSFSTTLGNFTKIEVTANNVSIFGPGWNGTPGKKTWTGNASSLSFNGSIMGNGQGVTLKFTIAESTVAVTGVTLNQSEAQMTVGGETLTLTATVNPNNATDQSVSWSTSDANVATVDNGVVTAVAAGNATITVTTTDGSFTATCAVTVTAPEPEPATTVVTITDSDFPAWGKSCTKDGVTVSAEMIDGMYGNIGGPGSFSTTLGNFTQIEVNAMDVNISGEGWSGNSEKMTWTGNASSVSFTGDINGDEEGVTLKFTIEAAAPTTYTLQLVADPEKGSVAVTNLLGSGIVDNGNGNYTVPADAEVTILATPLEGYEFSGWKVGNIDDMVGCYYCGVALNTNDNPLTFTMTEDKAYLAEFEASAPAPAEPIVVTWNDYDIPSSGSGKSFTKDGVTITCGGIEWEDLDFYGGGTFTTDLGNFTKIEVYAGKVTNPLGEGWSGSNERQTWTGNASSVSFSGEFMSAGEEVNLTFTIEPKGAPTGVENVQTNPVQATKFFRDGQLLIERDGKIFNVTGAQVK